MGYSDVTTDDNERILDHKTTLDSPGLELSEYVAKFYLNVTDDVTGRVKRQIIELSELLLLNDPIEL